MESRSGKNYSVTSSPHRISITLLCSWQGTGVHEEGINIQSGKTIVKVDPGYFRPAEVEYVPFSTNRVTNTDSYLKVAVG